VAVKATAAIKGISCSRVRTAAPCSSRSVTSRSLDRPVAAAPATTTAIRTSRTTRRPQTARIPPVPAVCLIQDECVQRGSVQFCGPLSNRAPSAIYVGVLLDQPGGSWDGYYKNTKLCSIPSPEFGALLPLSKITP
ncbi:hypothetical protein M9458_016961, partial [Cirrhinus mrigala]